MLQPSLRSFAVLATRALLFEAAAFPKPGLVDPFSNGAHSDMDYFTFLTSASEISPWFIRIEALAEQDKSDTELLAEAREIGKNCEIKMLSATNGVNTHKGAIFLLGLLILSASLVRKESGVSSPRQICDRLALICKGISERDFSDLEKKEKLTNGEKLFLQYGIRGVRGEVESGLPTVLITALPTFIESIQRGLSFNDAMIQTLFCIMRCTADTNVYHRSGIDGITYMREASEEFFRLGGMYSEEGKDFLREADKKFIQKNISPGGCADLLAATLFLYWASEF